jgi:hypothetical protein
MISAYRQSCHQPAKFVYQFLMGRAKHAAMKSIIIMVICMAALALGEGVWARTPTEADLLAGTLTAEEIGTFFEGLPKKPSNVAIFDIKVNPPLDQSFGEALEGEVVRVLRDSRVISIMNCFECRSPRMEVREDKLVVKKGTPDQASITQLGKQLGVDSFLILEVFRTRFSLVTQVTLMQASDGAILGTKQIRIPALDWSDAGLQILIGVGPSIVSGGTPAASNAQNYSLGGHIAALEEVGFGKAGLLVGGVGGPSGGFGYVTPTVAWRGRWGSTGIYSLKEFGAGFGVSDSVGGVALRVSYALMLGSFTMFGVDFAGMVPMSSAGSHNPVTTAGTVFIGFSLGR